MDSPRRPTTECSVSSIIARRRISVYQTRRAALCGRLLKSSSESRYQEAPTGPPRKFSNIPHTTRRARRPLAAFGQPSTGGAR